jgi:hypothetical protein
MSRNTVTLCYYQVLKLSNIDGDGYLYCYTLGVTPYNNPMCDYQSSKENIASVFRVDGGICASKTLLMSELTDTYLPTPWSRVLLEKMIATEASQEFPRILWNPRVHVRVYKSSLLVSIISQTSPIHAPHPTP